MGIETTKGIIHLGNPINPSDILAFDGKNVPVLKKLLDDLNQSTERTIFSDQDTAPVVTDVEIGTKIIWDNGSGQRRICWRTAENNMICINADTVTTPEPDPGTSSTGGTMIVDEDQDTKVDTDEGLVDEDKIRIDTEGAQRAVIDSAGLAITSGLKIVLDGLGGDTYAKYNSGTAYTELWTDGTKRIEY